MKKKLLITGANGQLGKCFGALEHRYPNYIFLFVSSKELDITNKHSVINFFSQNNVDYCVNCAAYTAVDKAEKEQKKAYDVNVDGAENLAIACKINNVKLIHISTDYVFDGRTKIPYTEECPTNPICVYGQTKLEGEKRVTEIMDCYMIIRTSWLYSEYNENFMNKMLTLSTTRNIVKVVCDQIGSPTSALDLARAIITILDKGLTKYGIYNYCNNGIVSWFEFAKAIFESKGIKTKVLAIKSTELNSVVKRPDYSVLECSKLKKDYNISIPDWKLSLNEIIELNDI